MLPLPSDTMTPRQLFQEAWPEENIEKVSASSICKRARALASTLGLTFHPDPRKKGASCFDRSEFIKAWRNYKSAA